MTGLETLWLCPSEACHDFKGASKERDKTLCTVEFTFRCFVHFLVENCALIGKYFLRCYDYRNSSWQSILLHKKVAHIFEQEMTIKPGLNCTNV